MAPSLRNLVVGFLVTGTALGAPAIQERQETGTCTSTKKRRSWHSLSDDEKQTYIEAELCLMNTPSTSDLCGSRTKFDDFQAIHVLQAEIAHFVGQFLPFHRLFVYAHEYALEAECGYQGGQPYWAEELDAGAFSKSILFDRELGFGGNGVGDSLCIQDGPFANYTNPLGPGYEISDHCIQRQISDRASVSAQESVLERCMNMTDFMDFWPCIEGGPHGAGHGGVGAQMLNPISSPGDPLFMLHHTWLDRLWAKWQEQDPETRLSAIGGNNRGGLGGGFPGGGFPGGGFPGGDFPGFPGDFPGDFPGFPGGPGGETPNPEDPETPSEEDPEGAPAPPFGGGGGGAFMGMIRPDDVPEPQVIGDPGNNTTLDHLLAMYGIVEDRTIAKVMDISDLCYEYD